MNCQALKNLLEEIVEGVADNGESEYFELIDKEIAHLSRDTQQGVVIRHEGRVGIVAAEDVQRGCVIGGRQRQHPQTAFRCHQTDPAAYGSKIGLLY